MGGDSESWSGTHNLKVPGSNPGPARNYAFVIRGLILSGVRPLFSHNGETDMKSNVREVWQEHQERLAFFIRSRISNRCDADDVLQDVFLKVEAAQASLRDRTKIRSWIYQVTRNTIVDYYRRHGKTVELPEDLPAMKKEKNAWALISRCVRPFIEKLPPLYREALLLSEIKGLTHAQVAKKLGISLPSAKARVLRGRLKLRKQFDDCCIFECGPRKAQIHSDTFCKEERSPP